MSPTTETPSKLGIGLTAKALSLSKRFPALLMLPLVLGSCLSPASVKASHSAIVMSTDFRQVARQKAQKYGLLPEVFERQIEAESGFNPQARSYAGARGIAQIMPATARGWGVNPDDPVAALDAAAKNMAAYTKTFLGGKDPGKETDPAKLRTATEKALRAYNAGPGAVEASKRYAETNAYVNKIIGPDKFSFTEALGTKQPPEVTQEPKKVGGRKFLIFKDIPAQVDPSQFLGDFLLKDTLPAKMPMMKPVFDPVSLLTQAAMQTPNYLGDI
jgi:hypothetical protein